MSTVAVTRLVEAPVQDVWRVFTHLAGRCEWLSTVGRVEQITPGPFGAGTAWTETRTMSDGGEVTEEFRVSECTPPERFVVASPGIGADYRMTYTFTPVAEGRHQGGTMVTVVQDGAPTRRGGRLLALIFGGLAARTVESALRRDLHDLGRAATRQAAHSDGDPATTA
ncbi:MAG TPA: SRPBCC family protein [Catenuloplanes sp.]|jgi:uncharacterized protein YndB with AHSA1/START domain